MPDTYQMLQLSEGGRLQNKLAPLFSTTGGGRTTDGTASKSGSFEICRKGLEVPSLSAIVNLEVVQKAWLLKFSKKEQNVQLIIAQTRQTVILYTILNMILKNPPNHV